MNAPTVAEVTDLSVALGRQPVIEGLDVAFREAEFVALLGANGSGKTTLVRALLGLIPSTGDIRLFGRPLSAFRDWARIGYVPQRLGPPSGVPATVEEVVLTGRIARARRLRGYSAADRRAVAQALDEVGLEAVRRRRISDLSGGQQQRVLIARALVNRPSLLVLDEPVSSVDLENQDLFARALGRLSDAKATVLLVAHSLGAMEPLVDRTIVLDGGRIAYDGSPRPEHQDEHAHHHDQVPAGGLSPGLQA